MGRVIINRALLTDDDDGGRKIIIKQKNKQNLTHREHNVDEQMDATFQSVTAVYSASVLSHGEEVILLFCIVSKRRLDVCPSHPRPAPRYLRSAHKHYLTPNNSSCSRRPLDDDNIMSLATRYYHEIMITYKFYHF